MTSNTHTHPGPRTVSLRSSMIALVILGLVGLTGCGHPYVNIPAEPGDALASNNPNNKSVKQVVALAVQAINDNEPMPGPYTVVMPPETTGLTYASVLSMIGDEQAISPKQAGDEVLSSLRVSGVRVRASSGQVDVVRVEPGGYKQLMTVYLDHSPFSSWRVLRVRQWRGVAIEPDQARALEQKQTDPEAVDAPVLDQPTDMPDSDADADEPTQIQVPIDAKEATNAETDDDTESAE